MIIAVVIIIQRRQVGLLAGLEVVGVCAGSFVMIREDDVTMLFA